MSVKRQSEDFGLVKETLDSLTIKGSHSGYRSTRRKAIRPYPSQAVCQRRIVLESDYEGYSESDITFTLYTQIGNLVEKHLKNAWDKTGNLLASSFKIPENVFNIGGEIDAIVKLNGEVRIIEVKTCDALPLQPKSDHYHQALTYSALTGLPFSVYYMSRNLVEYVGANKKLKTVQFDYDYDFNRSYDQMLQIANGFIFGNVGLIPDKPKHLTAKSHCGYCKFIDHCWNNAEFSSENFTLQLPSESTIKLEKQAIQMTDDFMELKNRLDRQAEIKKLIGA